jgi:DNA-binding response OmpR family regulator
MSEHAPNAVILSSDASVGDRIAYWLSTAGHRPAVAGTGYVAHRAIVEGSTRLLITDRLLPPWPGLDTMFGLKQSIAGLTIAFLGDGVPDTRRLALQAGADLILPTPLRRIHVLEAMELADSAGRLECAS